MEQNTEIIDINNITFTDRYDHHITKNHWLLVTVTKGRGTCRIHTSITNFQKQDCILISTAEKISFVTALDAHCELLLAAFTTDTLFTANINSAVQKILSDYFSSFQTYTYFPLKSEQYTLLVKYFDIFVQLQADRQPYSQLILQQTFYAFLLFIARAYFTHKPEKRPTVKEHAQRLHMIEQVKHYINQNYSENLSLANIASYVFTNPSYLSRIFKEQTGTNLSHYLNQIRIANAKLLLSDTDELVVDIAVSCGFNYIPHFNRVFKELTTLTPSAYRQLHKSKRF